MTSLDQQKDLFTKRWRRRRPHSAKEHQLQIALIQQLKYRGRPGVVYYHVPNGELRDKRAAAKLKAMGVLPGVSDLVFVWKRSGDGAVQNLYLEMKAPGKKQSPEQKHFAELISAAGGYYHCTDSLDDAVGILQNYHIVR